MRIDTDVPMSAQQLADAFNRSTQPCKEPDWPICCNQVMKQIGAESMQANFFCKNCRKQQNYKSCRASHRQCAFEIANPIDVDENEVC